MEYHSAGPEGNVGLVRPELSCESKRDDQLEDKALHGDDRDHAEQGLGKIKALQKKHDLEKDESNYDGNAVRNSSQDTAELCWHTCSAEAP